MNPLRRFARLPLPPLQRPARLGLTAALAGALALPMPGTGSAQSPVGALVTFVMPAGDFGSNNFTNLLVNTLAGAKAFCGKLDSSYRVDCLAERISKMSSDIPAGSDYAEVKKVLDDTARDISNLARANRDRTQPRQKVSAGSIATARPLTPVSPAAQAAVNAQASAILDRTATLLLRSPDDEGGKKLHYQRIAAALGSNKTLLRST